MELLQVMEVDQAQQRLGEYLAGMNVCTKRVKSAEALGETLAEDVHTGDHIPAFSRSTVDGYAVLAKDTGAAGESLPVFLTVSGTVEMGRPALKPVSSGSCVYVPTGGMLPEGADAVVMVEYTEGFGADGIAVYQPVAVKENVVLKGEDMEMGTCFLKKGTKIRPQEIGALAAAGITEISVYSQLKAAIISTGDELVAPTENPELGQVRDINTGALAALARKSGYDVVYTAVSIDDEEVLKGHVSEAVRIADVVFVSGGSSQGNKDATRKIFDEISCGGVFAHGLAIKPGKPTILGYDEKTTTLLAGLPGHPVSAMMVFETLFSWLARSFRNEKAPFAISVKMGHNLAGSPGKLTLQPVSIRREEDGYYAEAVFGKSGLITSLTRADGYIRIERNQEGINKGEEALAYLF